MLTARSAAVLHSIHLSRHIYRSSCRLHDGTYVTYRTYFCCFQACRASSSHTPRARSVNRPIPGGTLNTCIFSLVSAVRLWPSPPPALQQPGISCVCQCVRELYLVTGWAFRRTALGHHPAVEARSSASLVPTPQPHPRYYSRRITPLLEASTGSDLGSNRDSSSVKEDF